MSKNKRRIHSKSRATFLRKSFAFTSQSTAWIASSCSRSGLRLIEMQGVRAVGLGVGGVVVDFEEDAVDTRSDGGAGEDGNELRLAAGDAVGGGGRLDGVGAVEDDWRECTQDGQRAHVDHEVVIAETGAALREEDARVAGGGDFFDGVLHVAGGDELTLLHVDGAAGLAGSDQQVGLAAEEGGDLQHVAGLGDGRAVRGLVHVSQDGKCVSRRSRRRMRVPSASRARESW